MFSLKSFIVYGFTFRSLTSFEFIFVYDVRKCSNFILLQVAVQFSQHHLLKRLCLPHCIFLPPLSKIRYPQGHGFISGLSILFHQSIFLFQSQYHTVLKIVDLQFCLKSGRLTPPAPFFLLKIALAVWNIFCFHTNCEIFCSSSVKKCHWYFDSDCIESVGYFGWYNHFHNTILPIQEHALSLYLFMWSLISFFLITVLQFYVQRSSVSFCCAVLLLQSRLALQPYGLQPTKLFCLWDFPGKNI